MPCPLPSPNALAVLTERLETLLAECDLVADHSQFGQTFNDLENFFITQGPKFIQEALELKLQERIDRTEATDEAKQCSECKKKTAYLNRKRKTILSAYGDLRIWRRRRCCRSCKTSFFPVAVTLGLPKRYSNGLKQRVAHCVGLSSYRLAARTLKLFTGIHLSPSTIGEIADETAGEMEARLQSHSDVRKTFQAAKGETEFQIDSTCINTRNADGKQEYRDVKIAVGAKRECGESALPSEWDTRKLPEPTATYAVASIENKEEFQERVQEMRRFLGIGGISSALGDGAVWIWSIIFTVFGKTSECLDIYHALENVSACGKALYGSGQQFTDWLDHMRLVLLSEGFVGMERELELLKVGLDSPQCKSLDSLLEYLRKNSERLKYCERLAAGRAIGSGMVEGACKNLIGKRLKQTKACWRVSRANKIAFICAALYSGQWERTWKMPS